MAWAVNERVPSPSDRRAGWSHDWQNRWSHEAGRKPPTAVPCSWQATGGRRGRAADGGTVYLEVDEQRRSVNYLLLEAGWVYPTFYSQLYVDLREDLAAAAVAARAAGEGVGCEDVTLTAFRLQSR